MQLYRHTDGDITYYARYNSTAKLDAKGRPQPIRIKIGLKSEGITEQYVKAKHDEIITMQRLGEVPETIRRRRKKELLTLKILADIYFENRELEAHGNSNAVKNIRNDKSVFSRHLIELANQEVEILSNEVIEKLKQKKQKEVSPKTVNNALTLLSAILNHAVSIGKLSTVPKISKLRGIDNARERYFSDDEIRLILEAIKDDQQLKLFVMLSLSTGGRLETLRAIQVKDINIKAGTINLTDYKAKSSGKGQASYTGYVSDKLKPILVKAMHNKMPNDYIFQHENGTRIGMDYIQGRLQKVFNVLFNEGLDTNDAKNRAVVHTLRHTFASLLAIGGTPIYTIQRLMNHADIKMTLRYAKLSPDNGKNAVNQISIFKLT
ncbi:MAG: site-specific recombinase, phage integrase family [Burkholderiales bacterium]|nr:site-specific recombinase, phage integrase family [Burkholderiales bacterium]